MKVDSKVTLGTYGLSRLALLGLFVWGSAPTFACPDEEAPDTASSRWGANYFPNVPLVTHEGKPVRFFDDLIKDKVVAINFIYTSCPDSCPLETARLKEVRSILGDRVGRDVFMYSITIDPDLLGVTDRRERGWLARWLAEPEKMLAEKDPIIMPLYNKFNQVPMPNMRLNEIEVDALIDYIDIESTRVENTKKTSTSSK